MGFEPNLEASNCHCLLGLAVQHRVLNQRIDKDPHMFFDLGKFDCCRLVLFSNGRNEILRDLVCNVVDVRATLYNRYRVGERDVPEGTVLPAVAGALIDDSLLGLRGAIRVFHGCFGSGSLKSESVRLRSIRGVSEISESSTLPSGSS